MSKHALSPAPLPPAKRVHTDSIHVQATQVQKLTFDNVLYDELILSIFSHLSWTDLCAVQATSKNLYRLGADNELWRFLYLQVFGRPRLRGGKGFSSTTRSDGKEVKPLPGRASNYTDWKWMFRVSSNWRKGRCAVEYLHDISVDPAENHIIVTGPLTITAGRSLSRNPAIRLRSPARTCNITTPSSLGTACWITQMVLDQSLPVAGNIRLAAFLSTGEFNVFSINTSSNSFDKPHTYTPVRRPNRVAPIVAGAYHHPLLVTLSETFTLSLYDLSSANQVKLVQALTSFSSYPPTSLVLSAPSAHTYKLVLAHTAPVYPCHWSAAATEFIIAGQEPGPATPTSFLLSSGEFLPFDIISTRRARAIDIPQGWVDEAKLRLIQEQTSRKVLKVADTQTDGKWVVLAPAHLLPPSSPLQSTFTSPPSHSHTNLQLYRLSLPAISSIASSPPKLTFVRSLIGQLGPVSALALADGRCVSLGVNGSIWVWDLEGGTGAQVSAAREDATIGSRGTIVFDDRRIITSESGRTVVRRFDI